MICTMSSLELLENINVIISMVFLLIFAGVMLYMSIPVIRKMSGKDVDDFLKTSLYPPTQLEWKAIHDIEDQLGAVAEWAVVRDDEKWDKLWKHYHLDKSPKAFTVGKFIYIRKTDMEEFSKLCIHELHHVMGYKHGEEMFEADVAEINRYADNHR